MWESRYFVVVKKIIAIIFLLTFGLTTVGATVAAHACGDDYFKNVKSGVVKKCTQHNPETAPAAGHCHENQLACKQPAEPVLSETLSFKDFGSYLVLLSTAHHSALLRPAATAGNSISFIYTPPIPGIRLHLYNRVLLI